MIGGLWNGISGLNSFEKSLNAESNNVANVNTIGHKSDTVSFQDLMYQNGYGKGTGVQTIEKDFSQGNLKITGNPYDVAIDGKGFFLVKEDGTNAIFYTRAGNFKMAADGTLQSVDGMKVQGIQSAAPQIIASDANDTQFTSNFTKFLASRTIMNDNIVQTINTRATDYEKTAQAGGISGQGYKTASSKISDIDALSTNYREKLDIYASNPNIASTQGTKAKIEIPYNNFLSLLNDKNDVIEVTINNITLKQNFDTDVQTTMNLFADKISNMKGLVGTVDTNGLVSIESLVPGQDVRVSNASINNSAPSINEVVAPSDGTGLGMIESARTALKEALENANAKLLDMTNTTNLGNMANLQTQDLQLKLDNLNISDNGFAEISIDGGTIFAKDGDNKYVIGALSTAYFNDELSLNPEGNNLFSKTNESGEPTDATGINSLLGKTLELSNSNLGENLTNLMVYQRAFEANSKSLTTSDEFLKTAIQLKK